MEESEKRRERLRAIRSEAACSKDFMDSQESTLSNPLVNAKNTTTPLQSQENSCGSPRFDFYTDPLASFSGDRKRNKTEIRTPNCSFASPLPCTTVVSRKWKSPQDPFQTPAATQSLQQQEISGYGFRGSNSNVGFIHGGSPSPSSGRGGHLFGSSPTPISGSDRCSPSPNSGQIYRWRNEQNPSPSSWKNHASDWRNAQNSSPNSGRGGFGWHNGNSSSPNSGRGGSGWYNENSPSPNSGRGYGRSGGRSRFFSVEQNPEKFFNTSMVEDPWKALLPVAWNVGHQSKSESWLPQSISGEKVKSSETPPLFKSQANLAEFLSVSFNEVIGDDK